VTDSRLQTSDFRKSQAAAFFGQPCPESIRQAAAKRETAAAAEQIRKHGNARAQTYVVFAPADRGVVNGCSAHCGTCTAFTREGGGCPGVVSRNGKAPACHSNQEILWRAGPPASIAEAAAAGEAEGRKFTAEDAENAETEYIDDGSRAVPAVAKEEARKHVTPPGTSPTPTAGKSRLPINVEIPAVGSGESPAGSASLQMIGAA
jgi:hypothetical protein